MQTENWWTIDPYKSKGSLHFLCIGSFLSLYINFQVFWTKNRDIFMYSKNFFAIHKEIVKILMYRDFFISIHKNKPRKWQNHTTFFRIQNFMWLYIKLSIKSYYKRQDGAAFMLTIVNITVPFAFCCASCSWRAVALCVQSAIRPLVSKLPAAVFHPVLAPLVETRNFRFSLLLL